MGRERRITAGVGVTTGTIPNYTTLAGTVTTSAANTKKLIYTGSNDIADIISKASVSISKSTFWIYVPARTPYISRVTGIHINYNDYDSTDPDVVPTVKDYTLTLETAIPSCSADPVAYVRAGVQYTYRNDGTGNATVNGITIKPGYTVEYNPYDKYSSRPELQPVCYVDASAANADVLIVEEL